MRTTISVEQYASQLQQKASRLVLTIKKGILSGAMRSRAIMIQKTREAPPNKGGAVNSGEYIRRWTAERIPDGAVIQNTAPYSGVIEYGRRPGKFPPMTALMLWAKRKLRLSDKQAKSVAFLIGRSIAKKGIKPRLILNNAIPELTRIMLEEIERELDKLFTIKI